MLSNEDIQKMIETPTKNDCKNIDDYKKKVNRAIKQVWDEHIRMWKELFDEYEQFRDIDE